MLFITYILTMCVFMACMIIGKNDYAIIFLLFSVLFRVFSLEHKLSNHNPSKP